MADENTEGAGAPPAGPSPEALTEARALGWVPKEEFRGDPARWSDAESFVRRGHEVLPILRQNNKQLVGELQRVQEESAQTRQALEALQASTEEIVKDRVAAAKRDLLTKIKEARDEGDVEAEVRLTDELADVRAKEKSLTAAPPPPAPAAPPIDPAFAAWRAQPENAWFGSDRRRTSLAMGIAQELRADPNNAHLQGAAFYQKVADEVNAMLAPKGAPSPDKVSGSRPSGGGGSGSDGGGKSYNDLPPEAKEACNKQAKRFAGTAAFKDEAAYRQHYTKLYFAE
jgi:hypothetical protein